MASVDIAYQRYVVWWQLVDVTGKSLKGSTIRDNSKSLSTSCYWTRFHTTVVRALRDDYCSRDDRSSSYMEWFTEPSQCWINFIEHLKEWLSSDDELNYDVSLMIPQHMLVHHVWVHDSKRPLACDKSVLGDEGYWQVQLMNTVLLWYQPVGVYVIVLGPRWCCRTLRVRIFIIDRETLQWCFMNEAVKMRVQSHAWDTSPMLYWLSGWLSLMLSMR